MLLLLIKEMASKIHDNNLQNEAEHLFQIILLFSHNKAMFTNALQSYALSEFLAGVLNVYNTIVVV